MASKRKYKTKKVPVNVLRESNGKVVTEHLFLRDMKMVRFFMDYMKKILIILKGMSLTLQPMTYWNPRFHHYLIIWMTLRTGSRNMLIRRWRTKPFP